MKITFAVLTFLLLLAPAYSQELLQDHSREEQAAKDLERKKRSDEVNRQYNATVRATGHTTAAKRDPWGGIREADPGKTR